MARNAFSGLLPHKLLSALAVGILLLSVLTACKKEEKAAAPDIRPVRTVTVEPREGGDTVSLTGEIQPRYQADIGFRVNGKILATAGRCRDAGQKGRPARPARPAAIPSGFRGRQSRGRDSGGRGDAEPRPRNGASASS